MIHSLKQGLLSKRIGTRGRASTSDSANGKGAVKRTSFTDALLKYTLLAAVVLSVFGHSPASADTTMQFDLPLMVNGAFSSDISATIIETQNDGIKNTEVTVPLERIKTLLSRFAIKEQTEKWFNPIDKTFSDYVSLNELRQQGLEIEFDLNSLEIQAKVPLLGISPISLSRGQAPFIEDHYAQSTFASGLNVFVRNTYSHIENGATEEGFGDTSVNFLGFTTIGGFEGWSLFYEADFLENDVKEFARRDIVLVRDSFKHGLRYSLGDIRPTVSDLQTAPDLLGFSVERNYREINPFRNLNPSGRSSFSLDTPATVAFEVNGNIVSERDLQPGNYSISDFPLTFGANNVKVYVDDGTSRREVANFSTFVDLDLLDEGLTNFGISAGVRREANTGRSRRYEEEPILLAYYQRGFSQKFTAGVQGELSEDHALLGARAVYSSKLGVLGLETNLSQRDDFNTGYNALLRYEARRSTDSGWLIDSDFQLRYQSEDFFDITSNSPGNEQWAYNSALAISRGNLSFSFGANVGENADQRTTSYSASVFKSFPRFTTSLGYGYSKTDGDEADTNLNFSVSIPLGGRLKGSRLRGGYRSQNDEYDTTWSNPASDSAGRASLERISLRRDDDSKRVDADLSYIGSRFEFDAQHSTSSPLVDNAQEVSQTTLNASAAIGFAGGKIAIGKTFTDGFVVVNSHKTLRGKKVHVKRFGGQSTVTTSKYLSTTLIPLKDSYNEQQFQFEVDDLPLGYDIGSGEVRLYPGNFSGYKYTLGSDAANTVLGKALWPDKSPLHLKSGKLYPENGGEEVVVFTNRTGRFVAEKVRFGKYTMVFTDGKNTYTSPLELKESKEPGLIKVGNIILEQQTNES